MTENPDQWGPCFQNLPFTKQFFTLLICIIITVQKEAAEQALLITVFLALLHLIVEGMNAQGAVKGDLQRWKENPLSGQCTEHSLSVQPQNFQPF